LTKAPKKAILLFQNLWLMRKITLLLSLYLLSQSPANSQGCVAIRSSGGSCSKLHPETSKSWTVSASYRYFKSFRHFVGAEEQKERMERKTEVINWAHAMNLEMTRQFNNRWSMGVYVPILVNNRSSLYEHGGNSSGQAGRHTTSSMGLGDIRVAAYRWILDPIRFMKVNVQAGLGIKFPTGDYRVQDFFIKANGTKVLGPVDQSIQLGDGGTGFTAELNAFYNINKKFSLYGNFFYLANPREQNGVSTARGEAPSATAITYNTSTMSVPDQVMYRLGGNYTWKHLTVSGGVRREAIPSEDLLGGSNGFRRPGFVVSIEPGLSYQFKKISAFATVPFAIERNRTQSQADKARTAATGNYAHGDAAFSDYTINLGVAFRL
jgi:hypothetical protein